MRTTGIAPLILVSALLVSGCNHDAPTAPSPPPAPPPPIPVTSMWTITVRLVAVAGGECVGETTLPASAQWAKFRRPRRSLVVSPVKEQGRLPPRGIR